MKTCLIFSVFVIISMLLVGCPTATPHETTAPPRQMDVPVFSQQDAIAIAQEHCLNSPVNPSERIAGAMIRRAEIGISEMGWWYASYEGNGKWNVIFRSKNLDGSPMTHRWSVFENNVTAVYLGASSS